MRDLRFNKPYRVHTSYIEEGKRLDEPDSIHYGRFSIVTTKYGFVTVSEMDWAHNSGKSYFSLFGTIINGYKHTAWLEEARLSDRQLKWLATHFIKSILNKTKK